MAHDHHAMRAISSPLPSSSFKADGTWDDLVMDSCHNSQSLFTSVIPMGEGFHVYLLSVCEEGS